MNSPRSRLVLGIAAVVLVAGLCFTAVWSVRGRLPAQPAVAVAPAADPALRTENLRLRAEVARLIAQRDAALAKAPEILVTASPVPPLEDAPAQPLRSQVPELPPHSQHRVAPSAPPHPQHFSAPQTFTSVSTAY